MKLWNTAMAGQKLGTKNGPLEVGSDGCVEVSDEDIQNALLNSGFRSEEPEGKPKAAAQPRRPDPVVEEKKAPEEAPEEDGSLLEKTDVEEEIEEEDEEEEIEIDDIGEYNARDAMEMISKESRPEVLEAWQQAETEDKGRKTVLKSLSEKIVEVS